MPKKMTDLISGLVLLGFSVILYFYLIPNYVDSSDTGAMSPRFFPRLGAILIGLGALALMAVSLMSIRRVAETHRQDRSGHQAFVVLLIATTMAVFILLFQWAGYFYAAPVLVAALMVLFGARNPIAIAVVTAGTTAALYAVFSLGLNLPLI